MLDVNSLNVIQTLCTNGYEAFVVGGYVRDMFNDVDSNDVDIATNATPQQLVDVFGEAAKPGIGTKFLVTMVGDIEVATYRQDAYAAVTRECTVTDAQHIEDDLSRRDFTINALALCPVSGDIIDLHKGRLDIQKRIIRFVGDPEKRIDEHPIRILRACRFLAKIDGDFSITTYKALRKYAHLLKDVPANTIMLEVLKAMKNKYASLFFVALQNIDALQYVFPSLVAAKWHDGGEHHVEDVFTHMMLAGDAISTKYPLVKLAAYLHDYGKPAAFSDEGRFIGHEKIGADELRADMVLLHFSTAHINKVCGLVRTHMYSFVPTKKKSVRKLLKKLADNNVDYVDWLRVRIADHAANVGKDKFTVSEIKEKYINPIYGTDEYDDMPMTVKDLVLSGGELISMFNLKPGPLVGQLHKELLNQAIQQGRFERDDLVEMAAELLNL